MYYIDANTFIYPALYDGSKAEGASRLLESIVEGEIGGATAALTIDEVVYILSNATDRAKAISQGRRILEFPNLMILDVDAIHLVRALSGMENWDELSPRDAIHYGTMTENGIYSIVTDDEDFSNIPDIERFSLESF